MTRDGRSAAFAVAILAGCSTPGPAAGGGPDAGADAHVAVDGGEAGMPDPTIELGAMQTWLDAGNALGLSYFPDEGTSVLVNDPFAMILVDGASKSTFLLGASSTTEPLAHLASAVPVLTPTAGEFDNGYAGISAVYLHTDGVYYGFYHGEDQVGMGTLPGTSIPGFYARIGLATSADGRSWAKGGYVIESFVPKRVPDGGSVPYDQGAAEPGAIASADGRWLYLYYTDHSRETPSGGSRPVVICMARADLGAWPPALSTSEGPLHRAFLKYYEGSFSTDGIGGYDTPVILPPDSTSNALEGHAARSASLGKYVMVYGVDEWQERAATPPKATVSGLYAAFSDDGVEWRTAPQLVVDFGVAQPGLSVSWEASILWDPGADTQGWMVYGYSPSWGSPPHYLAGRRIGLTEAP